MAGQTVVQDPTLKREIRKLNAQLGVNRKAHIKEAFFGGASKKRREQNGQYLMALLDKAGLTTIDKLHAKYPTHGRTTVANWRNGKVPIDRFEDLVKTFFDPTVPLPDRHVRDRAGVIAAMEWVRRTTQRTVVYDIDEEVYEHLWRLVPNRDWWKASRSKDMSDVTRVGKPVLESVHAIIDKPIIREVLQLITCSNEWSVIYVAVLAEVQERME